MSEVPIDEKTFLVWMDLSQAIPPDGEYVLVADSITSKDFYMELECGFLGDDGKFRWDDSDLKNSTAWMRPSFPADQREFSADRALSADEARAMFLRGKRKKSQI